MEIPGRRVPEVSLNVSSSLVLSHTLTLSLSLSLSLSLALALSLSLSLALFLSVSLSLKHTHTHTPSLSGSLSFSLSQRSSAELPPFITPHLRAAPPSPPARLPARLPACRRIASRGGPVRSALLRGGPVRSALLRGGPVGRRRQLQRARLPQEPVPRPPLAARARERARRGPRRCAVVGAGRLRRAARIRARLGNGLVQARLGVARPPAVPRGAAHLHFPHLREGRGVSDQYGVKDAACPISTG